MQIKQTRLLFCFFVLIQFNASASCETEYQRTKEASLTLSYAEFDQTPESGMRVLSQQGCLTHAVKLIKEYISHQKEENFEAKQLRSMRWHIAQMSAMTNKYEEAIFYAEQSLVNKATATKTKLRWNDYVNATISFLKQDKEALVNHKNEIENAKDEHFGNDINLKIVNSLIRNFDKSYKQAMSDTQ